MQLLDQYADLLIAALAFIGGCCVGEWRARLSWNRGWRAAISNCHEIEEMTLAKMSVDANNQYVRAKARVPRTQWRV